MAYRYKWVRTRTTDDATGRPDVENVERHTAKGWEPVGAGEYPVDVEPPRNARGETSPNLVLYRMAENLALKHEAQLAEHNRREASLETHVRRANENIAACIDELNVEHNRTDAGKGWGPIEGAGYTAEGRVLRDGPRMRHWKA